MKMYESAFATITDSIDEIRRSIEIGDQEVKRKLELIFSEGSLVVIPGPWATPIQYCRLHGLPYIIMLPSPIFTLIFSAPLYVPKSLEGNDLGNNFGKKLSFRLKLLWNTIFPEGHSFDIKPLTEYPVLRLVQSLPSLSKFILFLNRDSVIFSLSFRLFVSSSTSSRSFSVNRIYWYHLAYIVKCGQLSSNTI